MWRWVRLLFAIATFGPILLWIGAIAGVAILGGVFGCQIDESGYHPCEFMGRDVGKTALSMMMWAAWGPLIIGPFVGIAGMSWAATSFVRMLVLRRRG